MRNRAKCKKCQSVIESYHRYDYVTCKCGEISICGGQETCEVAAHDYANFLRVDDDGNEIIVKVKDSEKLNRFDVQERFDEKYVEEHKGKKLLKKELIEMLEQMKISYENLPEHAMSASITHYDFNTLLLILVAIMKSE